MSLDLNSKANLSQNEHRLNTVPDPGACGTAGELQGQSAPGLNRPSGHEALAELMQRTGIEPEPLLVQDLQVTGRQRDIAYPKLTQIVNNSRFQHNLQPRSHSKLSSSRYAPSIQGNRSRSAFFCNDLIFKRSNIFMGSSYESLPDRSKNNSGIKPQCKKNLARS